MCIRDRVSTQSTGSLYFIVQGSSIMKRLSNFPTLCALSNIASTRSFHQRFQRAAPAVDPIVNQTDFVGRVLESWPDNSITSETPPSLLMRDMPEDVQEKIAEFGGLLSFCKKNPNFFGSKQVNGKAVVYLSEMAANILTQKKFKESKDYGSSLLRPKR
eukprot:TRINITY_DN61574_c0_g1_i1.p1 TRINITY_DN61574_c0_g1~~TRINITY_DN61574_c0_g1_i1.p1  ORF type:complete len:159 (-),score=19.62 TRINITY_DN61574_c0_g1_i1:225-701(-)